MDVLVVAKEPVAGRVKTRLCPPCTPAQAAALAEGALTDTLTAALGSAADRVVLVLDGQIGDWCPSGVEVVAQVPGPFGTRLAGAWALTRGPALQIGMDTPQVSPGDLDAAMATLVDSDVPIDAVLGPALDGGWWLLGMHRSHPRAFEGVPMSSPDTGPAQVRQLEALGLRVGRTSAFRDLDTIGDLPEVAGGAAPGGRFRAAVAALDLSLLTGM